MGVFEFEPLDIPDVILIKPKKYLDNRGFFMEFYNKKDFYEAGIKTEFIQDNHSYSIKNVLRGLHFQFKPFEQAKLVKCVSGMIFDVAVDLRPNSDTFGKYVSAILSGEDGYMLYIPRGFAHGFAVLSENAHVHYKVDNYYAPEYEGGIIWNDPDIGIKWPINNPILSNKDMNLPRLKEIKDRLFK